MFAADASAFHAWCIGAIGIAIYAERHRCEAYVSAFGVLLAADFPVLLPEHVLLRHTSITRSDDLDTAL